MPESKTDNDVSEHDDQDDARMVVHDIGMMAQFQNEDDASGGQDDHEIDEKIEQPDKNAPVHHDQGHNHGGGDNPQPDLPRRQVDIGKHRPVRNEEQVVDENSDDSHDEEALLTRIQGVGEEMLFKPAGEDQEREPVFHGLLDFGSQILNVITLLVGWYFMAHRQISGRRNRSCGLLSVPVPEGVIFAPLPGVGRYSGVVSPIFLYIVYFSSGKSITHHNEYTKLFFPDF
ncbi:MAG: hypothetical protein ABSE54_04750 [Smithella sp.]